jgi:ABC-type nitrate/sulfonate/bicarbonate transport system ATPase subunit
MSSIRFEEVTRVFERKAGSYKALEPVTLTIADREFVVIVGPSGCGKTTLLRMAAGLDFPSSGRVFVGDNPIKGPGPDRAVVFQQFALFPWKTVSENIGFGLRCRRSPKAQRKTLVDKFVRLMGLADHEDAYPHQLSGGMQQRVAIARAYAVEPGVLLMDEPFGSLDAQTRVEMQVELIRVTRAQPRTVLFITHSVEEATYLADRVVVMTGRPGRIREIIEIASIRAAEKWSSRPVEEVMALESFGHIRTLLWRLLRQDDGAVSEAVSDAAAAAVRKAS